MTLRPAVSEQPVNVKIILSSLGAQWSSLSPSVICVYFHFHYKICSLCYISWLKWQCLLVVAWHSTVELSLGFSWVLACTTRMPDIVTGPLSIFDEYLQDSGNLLLVPCWCPGYVNSVEFTTFSLVAPSFLAYV